MITKLISIGKISNLCIIMEYCPNGNLREFLRNSRSWYNAEEESFDPKLSQVFGPRNLIYFAWQITKGMTFLTSRKVKFPHPSISLTRSCTQTIPVCIGFPHVSTADVYWKKRQSEFRAVRIARSEKPQWSLVSDYCLCGLFSSTFNIWYIRRTFSNST